MLHVAYALPGTDKFPCRSAKEEEQPMTLTYSKLYIWKRTIPVTIVCTCDEVVRRLLNTSF